MKPMLAALLSASILASAAPALAQDAALRPDQQAYRALYKEMVETDTSVTTGSCTALAGKIEAHMLANGFKAVVDIDLLGTYHTCRAAFAHLRKPGASVIAISATQALAPALLQAHVCAAKAGIEMQIRVLAMEWGGAGVRVNSLVPGPIADTIGMAKLAPDEAARAKIERAMPLGRWGTKREIAEIALFLASPAAALMTGSTLVADGGQVLGGFGALALG